MQQKRNAAHGSRISAQRAAGGAGFMGFNRGPLVPSITSFVVCSLLERYCPTFVNPVKKRNGSGRRNAQLSNSDI
jgi:hypothetical protein